MLLNKEKILDKGEVSLVSCSNHGRMLQDIQDTYFKTKYNKELLNIANATLIIKCPLFVQLNFSKFDFDIINIPTDKIEAYIPDISEIQGRTLEDKRQIHKYIDQTVNSLVLNAKSLPMDGCDSFVSQLTMPVAVYNKIIVHGSLKTWIDFLKQCRLPKPIESYRAKILDILKVEWKSLK